MHQDCLQRNDHFVHKLRNFNIFFFVLQEAQVTADIKPWLMTHDIIAPSDHLGCSCFLKSVTEGDEYY